MSQFFKSKYKLILVLMSLVVVITLGSVKFAQIYLNDSGVVKEESEAPEESQPEEVQEEEEKPEPKEVHIEFNSPSTMRGAFISPGVDFLLTEEDTEDAILDQLSSALSSAEELALNTIIINTNYNDDVIYDTPDAPSFSSGFDVMKTVTQKARDEGFYVYAVFDVSKYKADTASTAMAVGSGNVNTLMTNAGEFAEQYELDGILLDGYQNETSDESYSIYTKIGGAVGYTNYMRQTPEVMFKSAADGIRDKAPSTQVGLLADSVWANYSEEQELGSETTASYTALDNANADTRLFVEKELMDFIVVKAYGSTTDSKEPFTKVVNWWAELANEKDTPLYVMQSVSRVGTDNPGWGGGDELVKQAVELDEIVGVHGNVFDSLKKLQADPGGSTTKLMKYYKEDVEPELILTELEMTKPAETTYTTTERQVVFTGAIDPTEPVTINDQTIKTDQSGYFTATYDLSAGLNEFTIVHKEKTIEYKITRQINVLTEISPTGTVTTDGGMKITITAVAYEGSTVTATVGGQSITLTQDDDVVDEVDRDSTYKTFSGVYTAPAATTSIQSIGAISVTASWNGESKTLNGATITVNKKVKIEDGVPIVIRADQARTYPSNTLDNIPRADCYPLPYGAMDYAVGNEIVYKGVSYTVLASGLRVKSDQIAASSDFASGNTINDISVTTGDGFTYVTLKTAQQVSYNFGYAGDAVTIAFNNTDNVPADMNLSKNPLFSSATWSGTTLNLKLLKQGGFMGYKGYYNDSGDLVLRFNNTPASISGARIVIDPGHGGKDYGALGFLADYPEKTLNTGIAKQLAAELQSRGAAVLLLDTSGGMDLETRVAKAESFNADMFISVHNNTAPNASAKGTEVYYFYPFSKSLASSSSSNVSGQLNTTNRGAKQSYYTVTLSPQFASVLVECGFMSNKDEYEKLIRTKYHERIAVGIADGISSAISSAYTGVGGSGSEGSGTIETDGAGDTDTAITLNKQNLTLLVGKTETLKLTGSTGQISSSEVYWSSSDASVATIDNTGKVTAIKRGSATITAVYNDEEAYCAVKVTDSNSTEQDIPVTEIVLSHNSLSVDVGKTQRIDSEVYPSDATDKAITWKSSNTAVATVDINGNVKGIASGTAVITATSADRKVTTDCGVTVSDTGSSDGSGNGSGSESADLTNATLIEFFDAKSTMYVGSTQTMKVRTNKDKTVSNSELVWSVSDKGLASVSSAGVVTAKRTEGTFTVSADTKDGRLFDTYKITVTRDKVDVENITLNTDKVVVTKGSKSDPVKVTITPSNATASDLNWSTANSNIATVDNSGVVTGKAKGSTTLIIKTSDGKKTVTCRIEVVDVGSSVIEELYIYPETLELWLDEEDYLDLEMEPSNVSGVTINWSSSQPAVVSVDSKGNIKALSKGKATITASLASDPTIKATCIITVSD